MKETSSSGLNVMTSAAVAAAILASSSLSAAPLRISTPSLVQGSVITESTSSKTAHFPGEARDCDEMRAMKIRALRGKYRDILTPSDQFAKNKQKEIDMEG